MGHGQAFSAVCPDKEIHGLWDILISRTYVIPRKQRIVPSVAGERGDDMAPALIHHCPSKY
eukprot:6174108-Pleurochrysis_carterae.AAC.1